ncbi:DUF4011 domain-containing protein [Dermabacteraceae bacterium P13136]
MWMFGRKKKTDTARNANGDAFTETFAGFAEADEESPADTAAPENGHADESAQAVAESEPAPEREGTDEPAAARVTNTGSLDITAPPLEDSLAPRDSARVDASPRSRSDLIGEALGEWSAEITSGAVRPSFLHNMRAATHFLDLSTSHPSGLAQLLAGRGPTRLSSLVREVGALADARRHARAIRETAQRYADEAGLITCHLAIGEARWYDPLQPVPFRAPVLLRPIMLNVRGKAREDIELVLDKTVELNPFLLKSLRDAGVALDARALLAGMDGFDPNPLLQMFRSLGEPLPGFAVDNSLVVGNLIDTADSLVDDLSQHRSDWADNRLIAALAGDEAASRELRQQSLSPEPPLTEESLISAVDSDEMAVVSAVLAGADVAVETAAGAGVVDTLMNLAQELHMRGKNVLVLAQRRSSLQQLAAEAERRGMRDLVLDLSPSAALQRTASEELRSALCSAGSYSPPASLEDESELVKTRQVLAGHVAAMHRVQEPWGVSAHDALSALADLTRRRPSPRTKVRLSTEVAARMVGENREEYASLLRESVASGALSDAARASAWYGCTITTDTQATRARELVQQVNDSLLEALSTRMEQTGSAIGLRDTVTLDEWQGRLELLAQLREVLVDFQPSVFAAPLEDLVAATATKQWRNANGIEMGFGERRRLVKQAQSLVRPGAHIADLFPKLAQVRDVRARWVSVSQDRSRRPSLPQDIEACETLRKRAEKTFDELSLLLRGIEGTQNLARTPLSELRELMAALLADADSLNDLPHHTSLLRRIEFEGLSEFAADLAERNVPVERVADELELAWWRSVLEHIAAAEPTISQYDGVSLSQVSQTYRRLDAEHISRSAYAVRTASDAVLVETMKANPDTSRALIRDLSRASSTPLRDLAAKYESVIFRALPLWLASPYVVPQVVPPGRHFDVVIVADAGRLPTAAAIPALARAKQVVAIGDPFDYADTVATGSGLLLDDMRRVGASVTLRRDETPGAGRLRQFVRDELFSGQLLSVPSPLASEPDRLVVVPNARGPVTSGEEQVESTEAELKAVTDLVIDHARTRSHRSLAVLTLTPAHAHKVMARIMQTVSVIPSLNDFFAPDSPEFFTVLPAQQASTILRDDVIVSLGFGKTPHDRLIHKFGPLSGDGGVKALASVMTRARGRTTVVSAFGSEDLDPHRLRTDGGRRLREMLRLLEKTPQDAPQPSRAEPDPLIADLADRLWRLGLVVETDYGHCEDRIELALGHPDLPGQFLVAVETDGDLYLNTPSQRERDRLRAERLERAGWTVERVWSWALFINPQGEAERIAAAVERARKEAVQERPGLAHAVNVPKKTLKKPKIAPGHPLSYYGSEDFDAVVDYICSDGVARLEDNLAAEVRDFLGFTQRTVLLDISVASAIRRYQERL